MCGLCRLCGFCGFHTSSVLKTMIILTKRIHYSQCCLMNSRQLEFMLAVGIYNTKLIVRICGVAEQGLEACTLRLKV